MGQSEKEIVEMDNYLKNVSLSNYKSINNLEIDFKPGLNIIIGKNASGKTNFMTGLDSILTYDSLDNVFFDYSFEATIGDKRININKKSIEPQLNKNYPNIRRNEDIIKVLIDGFEITADKGYSPYFFLLSTSGIAVEKTQIKYNVVYELNTPFVNIPFSFEFYNNGKVSENLSYFLMSHKHSRFIDSYFHNLNISLHEILKKTNELNHSDKMIKENLISFSESYLEKMNNYFSQFSPIKKIRLNENFNIITEIEKEKRSVHNFYIEFQIDQSWLPYNFLSDGTKRLFYILSEILTYYNNNTYKDTNELSIILLEEPELGIHPHQLHKLLQFIKEQSREKQIILTTHSPQVLDILEPNELDRIIICSYDKEKGTQLNHLTQKQMDKAAKYMKEEAFLSDYWRFSDLEPAS
jgi:predicted ATP-dependent endonuclease of OLD family